MLAQLLGVRPVVWAHDANPLEQERKATMSKNLLVALSLLSASLLAQAPVLLGDLRPGPLGSRPSTYVLFGALGQRTLFNADDGSGNEPWITDGTPAGTFRLGDLMPGPGGSTPTDYTEIGGRAVFAAFLPSVGEELAVTDGTIAGTGLLADLRPGFANSNPSGFLPFREEVLFVADDGLGSRVFRTDGTPGGTYAHPVLPPHFQGGVVAGNRVFWLRTVAITHELWCWDGVAAPGVVTTFAQLGSQLPPYLVGALRSRALLVSSAPNSTATLWTSDGSAAGTQPFATNVVWPFQTAVANDRLFFCSSSSSGLISLWVSDGTAAGTVLLFQVGGGSASLSVVGDRAFLQYTSAAPFVFKVVYVSDGTPSGGQFLLNDLRGLVAIGSRRAAFLADDAAHGLEIWQSDGSTSGTGLFVDVRPGSSSAFDSFWLLRYHGGRLVFWADDGVHGRELFALHTGAGAQGIGGGCSDGPIPELFAADPVLGGQVTIRGRSELATTPGFVVLAPALTTPAVLGPCAVHVDLGFEPILVQCTTNSDGTFQLPPIPVPAVQALDGFRFAAQAAIAAPNAPLAGLAISKAVLLTFGS